MNAVSEIAPVGLTRDRVTWYAYLSLAYQTYLVTSQGNILPFLKTDLGLSYGEVSLHSSAIAVGAFVAGFGGERVVRRLGRTAVLSAAVLGAASGALLLCLASAAWQSIGACLVIGLFSAFIPAMVSAILFDLHGARRDIAYAESNALCYAFAIVGPLVVALATWLGWNWRTGMLLATLVGIAIVLAFINVRVPGGQRTVEASRAKLPPAYWAYFTMLAFAVALEFAGLLWAPSYLEKVVGLSPPAAAAGAGAFFAAMLIGRTAGVRLFRIYSTRTLYFGAMATVLLGFVAYWGGSGSAAVAIPGLFVIGLGIANLFALILGFAMNTAGAASDRASARAIVAPGLAILVSPPLLGTFADHAGLHAAQVMIPIYVVLATAAYFVAQALGRRDA
ncbi:MAG TPA: MFS transporter [Bauldia sp.]|nr:MFS transporter [Bauldia sp.]